MTVDRFIETRQAAWDRLEALVRKADRGRVWRLSEPELAELDRLYHRTAADLARARAAYPDLVPYLNRLVSGAHHVIYQPPSQGMRGVWRFYRDEAPRVVLRTWPFWSVAVGLLAAGFAVAFAVGGSDPQALRAFVPDFFEEVVERVEAGRAGPDVVREQAPYLTSAVLTNNLRVAMLAFGGGILFGGLTAYVLVLNGLMLGAVSAVFHQYGLAFPFWSAILAHGFLELTAIVLAGGAGLVIGWALVAPGMHTRKDALVVRSREGGRLLAVTVPLFVAAAVIEGFLSFFPGDNATKLAVGVLSEAVFVIYVLRGRVPPAARPAG
ncbi:MAG: stage II sporulation protein M [Armatimonadota bacterium]|nr:stage II sporulation protein M [Armatimonadota bacterium]MDR5696115.1 stage II sporulation protein M [Armatimonadota bacterium]